MATPWHVSCTLRDNDGPAVEKPVIPQHQPLAMPAAFTADGEAMDLIFIEGFTGQTVIGIHDQELHRPQTIRIDLTAGLPRSRACDTDRIGDTIDYGVVRERLHRLFMQHRVQLLEALAESIAEILVCEFGAHWVRVVVAKPKKFGDLSAVGVAIERRLGDFDAPPSRQRGARVLTVIGEGMVPGRQ
jgi:dihydroneopterin aldolase